ncbi:MAG: Flp pilus assembly protein CpaB [Planctomycetota bacterium]
MRTAALIVAIILGIAAAIGIRSYMKSQEQEFQEEHRLVRVVETRTSIESGEVLEGDMIGYKKVPADTLIGTEVTKNELERFLGQEVQREVGRGTLLRVSHFMSREPRRATGRLSAGKRAVTVSVDNTSGVAGLIHPGDHVNIHATTVETGQKSSTWTVLNDVSVLATDDRLSEMGGGEYGRDARGYSNLTLSVSPLEAQLLIYLKQNADLNFTLRPRTEVGQEESVPAVNSSNVQDLSEQANERRQEELEELEDPNSEDSKPQQ